MLQTICNNTYDVAGNEQPIIPSQIEAAIHAASPAVANKNDECRKLIVTLLLLNTVCIQPMMHRISDVVDTGTS